MVRTRLESKIGTAAAAAWNDDDKDHQQQNSRNAEGRLQDDQQQQEAVDSNRKNQRIFGGGLSSILVAGLLCLVSLPDLCDAKEVITNQFHVVIKRDAEHADPRGFADQVARDNGFHNLGPVSLLEQIGKKNSGQIGSV